ncbi:reverse transcriptase domain-containing protein [Tanacetum coccineum]
MQSLARKLAALNRFLSRSAKKSLPFFETLKDITKANKHDYRWTKKAEYAFQELKKMILDLLVLTTPLPKETLFVYLATSKEAVSAVLLVVRKGKQRPVHYVSRTLHNAESNYAPLEKIALALRHISRRLRSVQHASKSKVCGRVGHAARVLLANDAPGRERRNTQGMDVLRPLPEALGNVKFVIVAIDYFPKWIEAKPLAKTTGKETSLKTSNRETPYNLTFESEAVILKEIGMPTHRRMMIKEGEGNEEEMRLNLNLLTERREAAAIREARYKMKMEQYYNKRVRPVSFKVVEYVYRKNEASRMENLGKLGPKWEGHTSSPTTLKEAFSLARIIEATFEESVKNRFGPSKYEDLKGDLSKLLQLGTVEDYRREFENCWCRDQTTLGDAFSLTCIIEARFEAIAEKEQNIKEKADTTISVPSEEASPMVKGPLDANEDTLLSLRSEDPNFRIQEKTVEYVRALNAAPLEVVRSKSAEFSEDKESVEKVLSATKLPEGENSHSAYSPYHLEGKVNFEGVGNATPWAADIERRKMVKAAIQRRIWDLGIKSFQDNTLRARINRGWMYDVEDSDRFLSDVFCCNLDVFLDFAFSNKAFVDNNRIKCPCLECDNKHFKTRNDVMFHLYEKGFTPNYTTWFAHGETTTTFQHERHGGESRHPMEDESDVDDCKRMAVDEVRLANVNHTTSESSCNSNVVEGTKGYQKNLEVKLTSEVFKWKSKNKRIKLALPQTESKKIMEKHGILSNPHVSTTYSRLSIFQVPGQRLLGKEYAYSANARVIHCYILLNCKEVKPFIRLFDDLTRQQQPNIDDAGRDIYRQEFAEWFEEHVRQRSDDISQDLKNLAWRPHYNGSTYKGCWINGYKFHSQKHSEGKVKKLNGVCVRGSVSNGYECDYYGILDEILEVVYTLYRYRCVLFKCKWFDTPGGVGVKRKDNLVYIDPKAKLLTDNPFVLPSYTEQVYHAPDSSMSKELKDWWDSVKSQDEVSGQDEVKEHV